MKKTVALAQAIISNDELGHAKEEVKHIISCHCYEQEHIEAKHKGQSRILNYVLISLFHC